jgi:hypothetical protein
MGKQPEDLQCRRRASRIPMPLEVQLTTNDRAVRAIIRDISLEEDPQRMSIGVSLLHNHWLPLNQVLHFQLLSDSSLLFSKSECTLTWTRDFGIDGYLSGGRLMGSLS